MQPPSYEETLKTDQENITKNKNIDTQLDESSNPHTETTVNQFNPQDTLYVPPQLVNISNSHHVNPSYHQFQSNEAQRNLYGNYPKPDQPLAPSKSNGGHSTGFPGKSGATYNNVANRK